MAVEPIIQTQNDFIRNSITGAQMAVDAASDLIEKAIEEKGPETGIAFP